MSTKDDLRQAIEAEREMLEKLVTMTDGTYSAVDMFTQTEKIRAFEAAIEGGDPQVIFLRGSDCLAALYGYLHNRLNMSRSSPADSEEMALSILNILNKARQELNF